MQLLKRFHTFALNSINSKRCKIKEKETTIYLRQRVNQTIQRGNTEKKKMESKLTEKEVKAKVGKKNGRKIGT